MEYTQEQKEAARRELARRELARRQELSQNQQMSQPEETKGFAGIKEDISKIPGALLHFGLNYPSELGKSWKQIFQHPGRAALNAAAGLGEAAIGTVNLPHELYKYLNKKGIPGFETLSKYQLHIPDLGIEKKLGLDKAQEGDMLLKMMGGFAPIGIPGVKYKSLKRQNYNLAENALKQSELQSTAAENALLNAQNEVHQNLGGSNPNSLRYQLKNAKELAEEKRQEIEKNKNTHNVQNMRTEKSNLIEPKAPEILAEPELPPEHNYEPLSQKSADLLKTKEQKLAEAEANTKKYLGEGQTHHARYGERVTQHVNKVEEQNTKLYKDLDKDLEDKFIPIDKSKEAKSLIDNLFEKIPEHGITSEEYKKLASELGNASKETPISVNKFLKLYRTTRNEAFDRKGFAKENPNTEAGNRAYEAYEKLRAQEQKMLPILKNAMGKEAFKKFEKAQLHFKENVAPMRSNPTFREIAKKGKISGSILEKLIGTEEGQHLLQNMTRNDPELMRLAVGQEYAHRPHKLFEPNEQLETQFFPHMKELSGHMNAHQEALAEHGEFSKLHEEALAHDKEQEAIKAAREAERNKLKRAHEGKKTQLQKAYEKEKKQFETKKIAEEKAKQPKQLNKSELAARERLEKDHKKLLTKIKELEKSIPILEEKAAIKKQSLEQKLKNMVARDKARDELYRTRALIKKGGKLLVKYGSKMAGI